MKTIFIVLTSVLTLLGCDALESGRKGGTPSTPYDGYTADGYRVQCEPIKDERKRNYTTEQLTYMTHCSAQGSRIIYCSNDQVLCSSRIDPYRKTNAQACAVQRQNLQNGVTVKINGENKKFTLSKKKAFKTQNIACDGGGSVPNLETLKLFASAFSKASTSSELKFNLDSSTDMKAAPPSDNNPEVPSGGKISDNVDCEYNVLFLSEANPKGNIFETQKIALSTVQNAAISSDDSETSNIKIAEDKEAPAGKPENDPLPPSFDFFCAE